MSELNLTHSNGNKVKLTTPDTLAANRTLTVDGSGDGTIVASNHGNCFKAYSSSATVATVATTTTTNIICNTEVYDIGSAYNTSTGIFTPNVAGYYWVNGKCTADIYGVEPHLCVCFVSCSCTLYYHSNRSIDWVISI